MNIDRIRDNYAITKQDIYLNYAAASPIANSTISSINAMAKQMERPLSEHFYSWCDLLEETKKYVAELINAKSTEIAFCQNTSTGLSIIASAVQFKPGDRVLVPHNEFPTNSYVWQNLQHKGVIFEFFYVETGVSIVETLQKLDLTNVRLISVSAVSYETGRQYELQALTSFCRSQGILICLDAIQAIGAIPFDVNVIQPDFVACGAQKWLLGGIGTAFIYVRKELLNELNVPIVGWGSVRNTVDFSSKELDLASDMRRFEPASPNILAITALHKSLQELRRFGWKNIYNRIAANVEYLTERLNRLGIKTLAEQDLPSGIISFSSTQSVNELQSKFEKNKIHITIRENYLRVSPHFYTIKSEMDAFLEVLQNHFMI